VRPARRLLLRSDDGRTVDFACPKSCRLTLVTAHCGISDTVEVSLCCN
jgi:hypothetical protein